MTVSAIAWVIFEHAVARVPVRVSYPDGAYFATLDRPLAPGGTVAIQAITARTLHWRERFQGQRPRIHTQGFDETFQMNREAA